MDLPERIRRAVGRLEALWCRHSHVACIVVARCNSNLDVQGCCLVHSTMIAIVISPGSSSFCSTMARHANLQSDQFDRTAGMAQHCNLHHMDCCWRMDCSDCRRKDCLAGYSRKDCRRSHRTGCSWTTYSARNYRLLIEDATVLMGVL